MNRFELFLPVNRLVRGAFNPLLGAAVLVALFTLASTSAIAQFAGPTQLTLVNGWSDAGFSTSHAMVSEENSIVQFKGSIEGGTSSVAFTLPSGLRPSTDVYIPVDLCNANKGRLHITPTGDVDVQAETAFSDAQCFTSLDGASFALNSNGYTALTLLNGWTTGPFSTNKAAARIIGANVHFIGAIATTGTNPVAFTLPTGMRPPTDVYVPVDLCNANNGRLHITPAGDVDVQAEGGTFSNAQCFTSLDGAWFSFGSGTNFQNLGPVNGWTSAPFATNIAQAENAYGIVYFRGAISTSGTNAQPFTLAARFRPVSNVYVNVDLCGAAKGRLLIQTSGAVTVQAESSFSDAQCFTSLDGVSFVQ